MPHLGRRLAPVHLGALTQTSAPAIEPVSLQEQKLHMRVDLQDDDSLINGMILAARGEIEDITARSLITQSWKWTLDAYPDSDVLELPFAPVSAVTEIRTFDLNDASVVMPPADFFVDTVSEPARIVLRDGADWPDPSIGLREANAVEIDFDAGYGLTASSVPEKLRLAIKQLAAHFYENREATTAMKLAEMPQGVRMLVEAFRDFRRFS